MNYKWADKPYSGCREEKILSAKPIINGNNFRMLAYWVKERSSIHIKKDIENKPAPWTQDPVLQTVRFTNVRRELDRESKYLIYTVCHNPELSYEQKIANIFLFRMLNKQESVKGIFPLDFNKDNHELVRSWVSSLPKDFKQFKKAFMVSGMMGNINSVIGERPSGIESCVDYCDVLHGLKTFQFLSEETDAANIYEAICNVRGLGNFMAYQIFVDMTYCFECPVSENEFVVAGPGCKSGLKLIFERRDGMTPEECLFWLRNNWDYLIYQCNIEWNADSIFSDISQEDRYMNVMSLENCLCELSKYHRAWNGGFVTKKYIGGV